METMSTTQWPALSKEMSMRDLDRLLDEQVKENRSRTFYVSRKRYEWIMNRLAPGDVGARTPGGRLPATLHAIERRAAKRRRR